MIKIGGALFIFVVIVVGAGLLFAFPVEWLWNDIGMKLFSFPHIDVWDAWKLNILCGMLFKSNCNCK